MFNWWKKKSIQGGNKMLNDGISKASKQDLEENPEKYDVIMLEHEHVTMLPILKGSMTKDQQTEIGKLLSEEFNKRVVKVTDELLQELINDYGLMPIHKRVIAIDLPMKALAMRQAMKSSFEKLINRGG